MARKAITADEIRQTVKDENVLFLRLMFTDINGIIKNVEVPISQLEKVLNNKITFDGSSIDGFVRIEESDMLLYPDLNTWLLFPWENDHGKIARLICSVHRPDGTPFGGDPRNNLIRVVNEMKDAGFTAFNIGGVILSLNWKRWALKSKHLITKLRLVSMKLISSMPMHLKQLIIFRPSNWSLKRLPANTVCMQPSCQNRFMVSTVAGCIST